jgi:hypothetical protein
MRKYACLVVLMCMVGGESVRVGAASIPSPLRSAGVTNDGLSRFRAFTTQPPWIKHVEFRISGNQFAYSSHCREGQVRRGHIDGWVHFNGTLQPSGFYLRQGSNAMDYLRIPLNGPTRYEYPLPGLETVRGASGSHYWQLQNGHTDSWLAPVFEAEGGSPENGPEIICKGERGWLVLLQRLGILHLVDAEIEWTDDRCFTVRDNGWFFDTELLLLAQRGGWRIAEIPVRWVDDPDSAVRLGSTIWRDLRGVWRLRPEREVANSAGGGHRPQARRLVPFSRRGMNGMAD